MTIFEKEIYCIEGIAGEWLKSLGWIKGNFERKGKYCLVGIIRCAVVDYESEWMAECGEQEMTPEEFKLYHAVLADLCRKIGIAAEGNSVEELCAKLEDFNDNKCETLEDVLAILPK